MLNVKKKSMSELINYYKTISPNDIGINKEDIFYYRDKYSEIINYIKIIITESEDLELYNYLQPKGLLLINTNPGTDIIDFLKLISRNFFLDFIEFNYLEIKKTPDHFLENFFEILTILTKNENQEKIETETQLERNKSPLKKDLNRKKLIIIDNNVSLREILNDTDLLKTFLNELENSNEGLKNGVNNSVFIWLNHDYNEIVANSRIIFNIFDLFINVPVLNINERETILRNFSEKNPKIAFDVDIIVKYTENWEIKDIEQLIKNAILKQFLNSDINEISNEITDIIMDLIDSGEYIPSVSRLNPTESHKIEDCLEDGKEDPKRISSVHEETTNEVKNLNFITDSIKKERYSEFMLNQLYENAASKNYNELLIILDKINKKEPIEEIDRKIIAKYPFILNDTPHMALIYLEKAKKRVDLIKQAFGK